MCTLDGNKCPDCVEAVQAELGYWKNVSSALIHKNVDDGIWDLQLVKAPLWVSYAYEKLQQEKKEGKKK